MITRIGITRLSALLDRMYKRRSLSKKVNRMQKNNTDIRNWLEAKVEKRLDKMRVGLKELKADTVRRPTRTTVPDSPRYRWR